MHFSRCLIRPHLRKNRAGTGSYLGTGDFRSPAWTDVLGDLSALPGRQQKFAKCRIMLLPRCSQSNEEDRQHKILNVEPQKSEQNFEIHRSLFNILRFKKLINFSCALNRLNLLLVAIRPVSGAGNRKSSGSVEGFLP